MGEPSQTDVGRALKNLGHYRVIRAQKLAREGEPDGIGGAHLLAMGYRETKLKNIQGGAKLINGIWVEQDDPNKMDVGYIQISRMHHKSALSKMEGVPAGLWIALDRQPTNHFASEAGYVPRFEEQTQWTVNNLVDHLGAAEDLKIPANQRVRFVIAAHNAGVGGAYTGWKNGNVDMYTARGDYSADVLLTKKAIDKWLKAHPNWKI